MDTNKRVSMKPDFVLEKIDGEITVFHPSFSTALYLNESGALIWELSNGLRSVRDIIDIIQETYPANRTQIENDVINIIKQFKDKGIAELLD